MQDLFAIFSAEEAIGTLAKGGEWVIIKHLHRNVKHLFNVYAAECGVAKRHLVNFKPVFKRLLVIFIVKAVIEIAMAGQMCADMTEAENTVFADIIKRKFGYKRRICDFFNVVQEGVRAVAFTYEYNASAALQNLVKR